MFVGRGIYGTIYLASSFMNWNMEIYQVYEWLENFMSKVNSIKKKYKKHTYYHLI